MQVGLVQSLHDSAEGLSPAFGGGRFRLEMPWMLYTPKSKPGDSRLNQDTGFSTYDNSGEFGDQTWKFSLQGGQHAYAAEPASVGDPWLLMVHHSLHPRPL
jgi:hypothetical protein